MTNKYLEIDDNKIKEKLAEKANERAFRRFLIKSTQKYNLIDDPYLARYDGFFSGWFRLGKVYCLKDYILVETNESNYEEVKKLLEEFTKSNKIKVKLEVKE